MSKIKQIVNGLNTHQGREACVKFFCYFSLFIYGWIITTEGNNNIATSFFVLSKQFSNCRIILRLLEDLPAIYNFFTYLNSNDGYFENPILKLIIIINHTSRVSYNIFEHVAWLADLKILELNSQLWWSYVFSSWACGLLTSIILNLKLIQLYYENNKKEKKRSDKKRKRIGKDEIKNSILFIFRDIADLLIAVNYLPNGFLWSNKIVHYQIGFLGSFAALCRVYSFVWNA